MKTEIYHCFDKYRQEFEPYGFTCEMWMPEIMHKEDKHNEIEINYLPQGSITYWQRNRKITILNKRLLLFWGMIPHKIIHYKQLDKYYVCTIPLAKFFSWNLPELFVDALLRGEMLYETGAERAQYDEMLFANWMKDSSNPSFHDLILLEMECRIKRLALNYSNIGRDMIWDSKEVSLIEQLIIYIHKNYSNEIRVGDVGKVIGVHSDYANQLFKKTFNMTIGEYIAKLRISHAQKLLLTTKMSISEIAYLCGFNSAARFNVAFKQRTECTPYVYRNSLVAAQIKK